MDYAVDTEGKSYLPVGHFDTSVDIFHRPHRWSEGEGHFAIEIKATPEGVVGKPTQGAAQKAKRPLIAILRYLTLMCDEILDRLPRGHRAAGREVTLRTGRAGAVPARAAERGLEVRLRAAQDRPRGVRCG